jgi:hypothetical protein
MSRHGYCYTAFLAGVFFIAPLRAQTELAFPHLAIGGNPAYETVLQIINEIEVANPVVIEVFQGGLAGAANGTPLPVRFDGGNPASSLSFTLTPYQEFSTILSASQSSVMNGWLRARSTLAGGKISGNLIFRQKTGSTIIDSVGATSPQRFRKAVIQVDQREAGSNTGLAFANPDSTAVQVILDLFRGSERLAVPVPVKLEPNQHYARLITEIFPTLGNQQATLLIETEAGRAVPCMALRLDGLQLTSIPVRPLGFAFQYTITNPGGAVVETGTWLFDLVGFNLIGSGKIETPTPGEFTEVTGSWVGTNFQFRYRKVISANAVGMVVFNGTSAGQESTAAADGSGRAVVGKVTTIGADGQVLSVNNFTAYHKFAPPPQ